MKLFIVHHHFRPGGVRRVIELATPQMIAHWPERVQIKSVVLATGEEPDPVWLRNFRRQIQGTPVKVMVQPAFGYVSEMGLAGPKLRRRVVEGIEELRREAGQEESLIWAHNLGLGRNLHLARELTSACHESGIPLIVHHHDWWFENRWNHFSASRNPGFRTLPTMASAILAGSPRICHVAINRADATVLEKHFPGLAGWLPNPAVPMAPPSDTRLKATRAWLCRQIGENAPVWLLPCRLLRRKNLAEALLLARWLRPEAWLVTTGGVSSTEEQAYAEKFAAAAQRHGWRLRLGILQAGESRKPSVPELLAASEAVLLTSLQEGFGLPYLEAIAARRPLIARELPNIAPDLAKFGFRFPHQYREVMVDPSLFDWRAERARQKRLFAAWRNLMPHAVARLVGKPAMLDSGIEPCPVPFSRLTFTAQLEVLAQPAAKSWEPCAALNPFLKPWREGARAGRLKTAPWPRSAARWLGGCAYAQRFLDLLPSLVSNAPPAGASHAAQAEFLRLKLRSENLYPILWNLCT